MPLILLDFAADMKVLLNDELLRLGYQPTTGDIGDIARTFFNVMHRRISLGPRMLHHAQGLSYPAKLEKGFEDLKKKMETGGDLNPHLSRKLVDQEYSDMLLNDWGIHHFHLGFVAPGQRLSGGTQDLLFAHVTPSDIYLLGIYDHKSFARRSLIGTMHYNWPELLEKVRVRGIEDVDFDPDETQIATLRKKGVQVVLRLGKGLCFFPLGGGYSLSGISTDVVRSADEVLIKLRQVEDFIRKNGYWIIANESKVTNKTLQFNLVKWGKVWAVKEHFTGIEVALGASN